MNYFGKEEYNKKFKLHEANIYADYHNCVIKVVVNDDRSLYVRAIGDSNVCFWFFVEDSIPNNVNTKEMIFSDFINELKVLDLYVAYGYSDVEHNYWHTDAYEAFTYEALAQSLEEGIITREQYSFLRS